MIENLTYSYMFYSIRCMLSNLFWPTWLGGTRREYRQLTAREDRETLERVRELVEGGRVKGRVEGVWEMDDVLKVGIFNSME
jgi:hypothetical protein